MHNKIKILFAALMLAACWTVADMWSDFAAYRYDGDRDSDEHVAKEVELLVQNTTVDGYAELEERFIAVLDDENATHEAKALSCRHLMQIGTERAIPALAPLLGDPKLSTYARLLLANLRSDPADQAMRDALESVPEEVLPGLLGSIAERRDRDAIPAIIELSKGEDASVVSAAVRALGWIGTQQSATHLRQLQVASDIEPQRLRALANSLSTLAPGEREGVAEYLLAADYQPARIAALQDLALLDPKKNISRLIAALSDDSPLMRTGALTIAADPDTPGLAGPIIAGIGDVPDGKLAAMLVALGSRGDSVAVEMLQEHARHDVEAVRKAAIESLGKLGDAQTVEFLLQLASDDVAKQDVEGALRLMPYEGTNRALVDALENESYFGMALKSLTDRGAHEKARSLLALLSQQNQLNRNNIWRALSIIAFESDIGGIMDELVKIESEGELNQAVHTVRRVCNRAIDKAEAVGVVYSHYDQLEDSTKEMLLGIGAMSGDSNALSIQLKAIESGSDQLVDAALRTLMQWPNELPATYLLNLARSDQQNDRRRNLALRGYIRIAGLDDARLNDRERLEMFKIADDLAETNEDRAQIVSGLIRARTPETFEMLEKYMEDEELKTSAELTAANLTWELRGRNTAEAKRAAEKLLESDNEAVVEQVKKTLEWIAER